MLKRTAVSGGLAVLILFSLSISLFPQEAETYFKAAQQALSEEQHESALESIKRAITLNPEELEYQYFLSLILIRAEKYQDAEDILTGLIKLDEVRFGKAYFDLAGIYLASHKLREAVDALKKAEKVDRNRSLLHQGYAYLNTNKLDRAIAKFKEIKKISSLQQTACYNLALAYHRKMDYSTAIEQASEAVEIDPETATALNARSLIEAIRRDRKLNKRLNFMLSIAGRADDNVILQPLEQVGLQKIGIPPSEQRDTASVFTLRAEYKPVRRRQWSLAFEGTASQYIYTKLRANNLTAVMPTARLHLSLPPFHIRLFYTFGYFVVDGNPYARVHSFSPALTLAEGRHARSELFFQADRRLYLDGITPDADHFMIGFRQSLRIAGRVEPSLGYKYESEDNREDKGDFISQELILGLSCPFIWNFHFHISYSYLLRKFDFTEVISLTQEREDIEHMVSAQLSRRFGLHVELIFSYHYALNDSNISSRLPDFSTFDPYHWKKNVISFSLSLFL